MSDNEKIAARIVGPQPIAKSFKGILRVSNIKEPTDAPDVFLNKDYYGEYTPTETMPLWEPVGEQVTDNALEGSNTRYYYEDEYAKLKLPVTDSVGNYMNFALGCDGSLIGSHTEPGFWDLNGVKFYTVNADHINIGMEAIKITDEKRLTGGKLFVDNAVRSTPDDDGKDMEPAKIAIDAYYRHGADDEDKVFTEVDRPTTTVYQGSINPQRWDAFIYNQESFTENEEARHNIVKLKSLRDYVIDRVQEYIRFNTTEVATGTIMWQYCSLDKWYCRVEGGQDDSRFWQGYRPALGNINPGTAAANVDTVFAINNTEQGVFSNRTQLDYTLPSYVFESIELPPEFKRGYVLADGSSYELRLVPPFLNDVESTSNKKQTLDMFLKLFFVLGYYYTPTPAAFPHVWYEAADAPVRKDPDLRSLPTYGRYYFDYSETGNETQSTDDDTITYGYEKYQFNELSKETLYGITLASIMAFKKFSEAYENKHIFNEFIADADGKWDIERSIEWLSNQRIDEEFVFNTVFQPETLEYVYNNMGAYIGKNIGNIMYEYKDVDNKQSIMVPLGKEVNKFSDYIDYYYMIPTDITGYRVINVPCEIYKTAEIYELARLFANKSSEWAGFKFRFNVPALYTDKDKDMLNYNTVSGSMKDTTTGLFIGSNGLSAADEIRIPAKDALTDNDLIYYKVHESYTYHQSNCTFSIGYQPHSHALAKGILNYSEAAYPVSPDTPMELSSLRISDTGAKNTLIDPNDVDNNIIAADTTWGHYGLSSEGGGGHAWANEKGALNYVLQERGADEGVHLKKVYNGFNGVMGNELAVFSGNTVNTEMKWYARTSGPIWDPNEITTSGSQKYVNNTGAGYFRPQSIKMLPLIKL